jgi:hypothetical protein
MGGVLFLGGWYKVAVVSAGFSRGEIDSCNNVDNVFKGSA